jgi:hypothetical protein
LFWHGKVGINCKEFDNGNLSFTSSVNHKVTDYTVPNDDVIQVMMQSKVAKYFVGVNACKKPIFSKRDSVMNLNVMRDLSKTKY